MGFYALIMGIGTIFIVSFFWNLFSYATDLTTDRLISNIPDSVANVSVNKTDIAGQYAFSSDFMYYSFYFIVIMICVWIVRVGIDETANPQAGG